MPAGAQLDAVDDAPPAGRVGAALPHLPALRQPLALMVAASEVFPVRLKTYRANAPIWMAAARAAHVNGDHVAEWRYRNTARMLLRRPPLTGKARCLR